MQKSTGLLIVRISVGNTARSCACPPLWRPFALAFSRKPCNGFTDMTTEKDLPARDSARNGDALGGIAILGGSFNPPHIGHLRLAIEVREAMGARIDRVDLLPCAHPPHKNAAGLLPFALRCEMLRMAARPYPWLRCNSLEGERTALSYTWDTLGIYAEREPGRELFFVLGSGDYSLLSTWHRGLELPRRCTLIVVPREADPEALVRVTRSLWPEAETEDGNPFAMRLPHNGRVLFLPIPRLDISATDIRRRLLEGRSLDFLLPPASATLLEKHRAEVIDCWR